MMLFLFIFYVVVSTKFILGEDCDKSGILIYEDLGCTPHYESDKKCPIKYSCKVIDPLEKNCYVRGRSYADKEQVDNNLTYPSCDAGCVCHTHTGKAEFTCAILECPEWFGGAFLRPGCYQTYSLDNCCSIGRICAPFDNITKCTVEGKEYKEGQKFYPSNSCLSCVCPKGKLEAPSCRRVNCGHQLRNASAIAIKASCAPFYSKAGHNEVLCCPDFWICPEGSEVIQGEAKSEDVCKFGDKAVKVGQYVEKLNVKDNFDKNFPKIRCECVIPPFLKCRDV